MLSASSSLRWLRGGGILCCAMSVSATCDKVVDAIPVGFLTDVGRSRLKLKRKKPTCLRRRRWAQGTRSFGIASRLDQQIQSSQPWRHAQQQARWRQQDGA